MRGVGHFLVRQIALFPGFFAPLQPLEASEQRTCRHRIEFLRRERKNCSAKPTLFLHAVNLSARRLSAMGRDQTRASGRLSGGGCLSSLSLRRGPLHSREMTDRAKSSDTAVNRLLKPHLVPFWLRWKPWSPPADHLRLMADLQLDGDAFYGFAEEFAERFCAPLGAPPAGPKGAVEICPPDLTIGEWKAIARTRQWPSEFWATA